MCGDPEGMCSDTVCRQTGNLSARVIECQGCRVRVHSHTLFQASRLSVAVQTSSLAVRGFQHPVLPSDEGLGVGDR